MRAPLIIQSELQVKVNAIQQEESKGNEANANLLEIWRADKTNLQAELEASTAAYERVEQDVQANGYIMDGLKSGEYRLAELAHTPEDYTLQAIAVQKWALEQKEAFDRAIDELNKQLHQALFEKSDAEQKRDNMSKLYSELQEQMRLQESGTMPIVIQLTPEEQDAEWRAVNTKSNNRIKVSKIRNADPTVIDSRKSIVTIALTREEVETETIYLKGRYIEISETEAEQLRSNYANKKAEIDAQYTVSPVSAPSIEPVANPEQAVTPFHQETKAANSGTTETANRDTSENEVVGTAANEEIAVITLESLYAEVERIKAHVGMAA